MVTQLINFVIPQDLLKEVDALARQTKRGRSELLREAVRQFLAQEKEREEDFLQIEESATGLRWSEKDAFKLVAKSRRELPMNQ